MPNITGWMFAYSWDTGYSGGALSGRIENSNQVGGGASSRNYCEFNFNASKSNSIYGKSTTVQPNCYVVNIWERIE